MADRPLLVGLTGSIGMGKSETSRMFASLGIPVYDADAAVHALYEKGGAAVAPIEAVFPGCVRDGQVDRPALAARVMNDPAALARLEAIVHPLAWERQRAFVADAAGHDLVVLDIPLLFETRSESRMDAVVVVSASPEVQRQRVMSRAGMTEEKFAAILSRQMPDAEKRARAHYVVDTGSGVEHASAEVLKIVEELRGRRKKNA